MDEEKRLMFYALKHLIQRDKFQPELREKLDNDLCDSIVEMIAPSTIEAESQAFKDEQAKEIKVGGTDEKTMRIGAALLREQAKNKSMPNGEAQ